MKLSRIEWTGYCVPFEKRFVAAEASAEFRHGLLLRLETDGGLVGFGEASPVGPGSLRSVASISDGLRLRATGLLKAVITDEASVRGALAPFSRLPPSMKFGVATALYDLLAKARDCPFTSLFGGPPKILPVNALLLSTTPKEIATEGQEAVTAGFSTLKLKVGALPLEEDLERLAALREAVGSKISLRLDANQAWKVKEAIETINRMEPFDIEYVEQPVPAGDLKGLAEVRSAVATPIAVDESVTGPGKVRSLIGKGAVDILVLKLARTGLLEGLEILKLAKAAGLLTVITSSLEADIGLAASLHVASSFSSTNVASGLATGSILGSNLVTEPLKPSSGFLQCPDRPGLGVIPDDAALMRYGTDIHVQITR